MQTPTNSGSCFLLETCSPWGGSWDPAGPMWPGPAVRSWHKRISFLSMQTICGFLYCSLLVSTLPKSDWGLRRDNRCQSCVVPCPLLSAPEYLFTSLVSFDVWESIHSCCTLIFITEPAAGFSLESNMSVVPLVLCTVISPRCTCGNQSVSFVRVSCDFSMLDVMGHSSLSASTVLCPKAF